MFLITGGMARCQEKKMAYKITITFTEQDLTAEEVLQTANFLSEQLEGMRKAHILEARKEKMILAKITK